jgi:pimeloyl-ACP methyl ester carboxylesterase
MERRTLLKSLASVAIGAGLLSRGEVDLWAGGQKNQMSKTTSMQTPFIAARDGTPLFYKDWGTGKPVVFLASWAMNSDLWQYQMTPMVSEGFRCVAYDRRGHGRSGQPSHGYNYDTLADDFGTLMEQLDLRGATVIGHSMAPGEIVRYLSRHGSTRISRIVLLAPTTPFILKTADNPDGVPREVFDQTRAEWCKDYPKWLADNARPFVMPDTSQAMIDWAARLMMQPSLKCLLDCNQAIIETDFRKELPNIKVPTLIIQGDKDVSAPLELTGRRTAALIPGAQLKVYEGAPHGLMLTHIDRLNRDLIAFARS